MDSIFLRRHFSRNILMRMIVLAVLAAGLLAWKIDFINEVYFRDQLTATGWLINGAIVALFLLGILKVIATLLVYSREESAVIRFAANMDKRPNDPLKGVSERTLIARRFRTMERLHRSNTPINQGALASTLVAAESTRNSFPKFINNILILTGVFGTIVALSIALLGASDLLESNVDVGGMGMVIHGMSTALSTTITAIVCYVFFGYFYLKLTDVQTNLVTAIEQVSTTHLVPRFQVQTDSVLYEFTGLIRSLQGLVNQMEQSQHTFEQVEKRLVNTLDTYRDRIQGVSDDLGSIKVLLKHGFRLPEDDA
ncbi:MAG: hypothetical protein PVF91_12940 [Chromatiales bacterium]